MADSTSLPLVEAQLQIQPRSPADDEEVPATIDLHVRSYELVETIGEAFVLDAMVACDHDLEPDLLAGSHFVLELGRGDGVRRFLGLVQMAESCGTDAARCYYRIIAGPYHAVLGATTRSRVFQAQTPHEIAMIVLRSVGDEAEMPALVVDAARLAERPRVDRELDYCVQYRENDLAFMQRVLAEQGITYLLRQEHDGSQRRERIDFVDDNAAFFGVTDGDDDAAGREPTAVPWHGGRADLADVESIRWLEWARTARPAAMRTAFWDWKASPPVRLDHEHAPVPRRFDHGEHYLHGDERLAENDRGEGGHSDRGPRRVVDIDAALEAESGRASGVGNMLGFRPGYTFALSAYAHESYAKSWLLTRVVHRGDFPEVGLDGGSAAAGANYENEFECVPLDTPWRPRRRDRPTAPSVLLATVVGPSGEEIHTDAHGRIKVHFPWDREGTEHAPDTSCWLRVAQAWAGPGWGTLFLPRVGMEVVVSFVDGDPDRPLCTGCVYNGANRPPYALPDERTKSTIKTASSPGGEGFNELRFEDARGSEQVFIHAERDLDEVVKAAHTMSVGSTQQISVGADQTIAVDGSRVLTIKGSQSVRIDGGAAAGNSTVLGHELGVTGKIVIDATDQITVQSPVGVKFICGPTIVELTPSSILLYAGAGAMLQLGGAATLAAAGGATSLAMGDDGKAKLGSIAGGALAIDGQVVGTSAAGSKLVLEGSISAVAAAGAKLELTTDVSTHGQTITSQASGAKLVLDQAAALSGLSVTSSADAGKMIVDSNGATVEGAQVAISGVSLVSVAAALLKLN